MDIELIGVPFDGYRRTGHQDCAAVVLRETGLVEALRPHDLRDRGNLQLPSGESVRGAQTSLLNEPALIEMTEQLNTRVAEARGAHRFPVVEDGEAANCEIGLLLGLTGRQLAGPLAGKLPALDRYCLEVIGQRDVEWR